ncbi:hypothetical protein E4U55_001790 [Claviceps digitariae]|nr:hypothetical protein E4U55_001790 [Claviceps digitariae]
MDTPTPTPAAPTPSMDHPRHSFLFGQHITHSLSPFLHQLIYDELGLPWRQVLLESSDAAAFVRLVRDDPSCYGASVTMPNKVAVLEHLDELTAECRAVGACNTVYVREEQQRQSKGQGKGTPARRILCGTNTDVVGIREALRRSIPPAHLQRLVQARPALVIGGGGAARSAVYALRRWLPVGEIYLVNRHDEEVRSLMADCRRGGYGTSLRHVATVEEARRPDTLPPGVVVSCVPDVEPQTEGELCAWRIIEALLCRGVIHRQTDVHSEADTQTDAPGLVLDMAYHPTPYTRLINLASRQGWHVILGTEPAIWQGLEQDRYWTGVPVEEMPLRRVQDGMRERVGGGPRGMKEG